MVTATMSAFAQSTSGAIRTGVWASAQHGPAASTRAASSSRDLTAVRIALDLVQRRVDCGFELFEQGEDLRIGERDDLRENDARHLLIRIDPEIRIAQPRPGEAPCAAAARHALGVDHESHAPFLDHAGKE